MGEWVKVKRLGEGARIRGPLVSVRKDGIAMNGAFVEMANIELKRFVTFHTDDEQRRILMEFSKEESPDSYTLVPESRKKTQKNSKAGCLATAGSLLRKPWVAAVIDQDDSVRRFEPQKGPGDDSWVISLVPCFEETATDVSQVPRGAQGIYRYLNKSGEVIYIGRGNIAERAAQESRKDWPIDRIEYSIIEDKAAREEWEQFWLDEFSANNGSLPMYNKIRASRSSGGSESANST
jgi:hypothetical protein